MSTLGNADLAIMGRSSSSIYWRLILVVFLLRLIKRFGSVHPTIIRREKPGGYVYRRSILLCDASEHLGITPDEIHSSIQPSLQPVLKCIGADFETSSEICASRLVAGSLPIDSGKNESTRSR